MYRLVLIHYWYRLAVYLKDGMFVVKGSAVIADALLKDIFVPVNLSLLQKPSPGRFLHKVRSDQ